MSLPWETELELLSLLSSRREEKPYSDPEDALPSENADNGDKKASTKKKKQHDSKKITFQVGLPKQRALHDASTMY
jgi:hypothetical protein